MKLILNILVIGFFSISNAQVNKNLTSIKGNWEWKDNKQTFTVHFFIEGNILKGDYSLKEDDKIIYDSNKLLDKEFNLFFGHSIMLNSNDKKKFTGLIKDNVLLGDGIHTFKYGELLIKYQQKKCDSCKETITWQVNSMIYNDYRKKRRKTPNDFSIPKTITLTKV